MSGGQQSRAALAREPITAEDPILLLDEPFSRTWSQSEIRVNSFELIIYQKSRILQYC